MIVFDLRCGVGHVFEAWFASGAAFEEQRAAGRLACPMCGDEAVEKALMAPAVGAKGNQAPSPARGKAMLERLAAEQKKALSRSHWVGRSFAQRARAIHAGEEPGATIHGEASLAEAKALVEDGVPVMPLPFPVTPPDQLN